MLADQLDLGVGDGALGVALAVGLDVAEVANVAVAVGGAAVALAEGVDCADVLLACTTFKLSPDGGPPSEPIGVNEGGKG